MAAAAPLLVHVESMQTAVPTRVAGTGRSLPIAVSGPPLTAEELQRRFRAVLYYRGAGGELEAAARERAAWVKESLSAALSDCPEMAGLAGRLRRGGDGRLWEVKLKDTGVRLVHASVEVTVAAFLEASGANRERKEAALALWTDVDAHEPDICAPFILQLTRFLDGGYAVGVSCSLLLADPLSLIGFLESRARKHAELQAQGMHVANPVIQYTRYLQSPGAAKRVKSASTLGAAAAAAAADNTATTVLFRAAGTPDHRALAVACVGKACEMLGVREPPRFTVMDRDGSEGLNVQACACAAAADGDQKPWRGQGHAPRLAHWREAGLEDMELEGSKPVHVSYSVSPCADEGLVIVMPAGGAELLISVTVPNNM
ncbi:hypothetical protein BS78_06G177900 [Paspalum vaginatum]|nr:hypothetical protein BS78_06G177900 [Paspalum vaginatum]